MHFSNRYVRTRGFQEEQAAQKLLHAGAFATGNPSGRWFNNPFTLKVLPLPLPPSSLWTTTMRVLH